MKSRSILLVLGSIALLGALSWTHDVTAGIEDPPVCGFAAGMVDHVANASLGSGLNYATGFEPEEGFGLGFVGDDNDPAGCGGPANPCWGTT